ncbi:hypothetical protein RhiLY_09096 [Ceratobasidium sp. AG-Ba]|nr:hypothetical protein RhiLY_09096 [Ceratobasidium sp. AG-Ba]
MPATNPADQEAARAFESALRTAIKCQERSPVELRWFTALPKRIRRSRRLLEAAIAESLVLLDAQRLYHETSSVYVRQTRKLGTALGGAKIAAAPSKQPPVVACLSVDVNSPSSPLLAPDVPTRPPTPDGLREAAFSCIGLLASASGVNAYGHNTPCPMPIPPARIIRRPPSFVSPPQLQLEYEGETVVNGQEVDSRLAYLVALGRWESCKWARVPSLREAAENIIDAETLQLGALAYLTNLFFPQGLDDWSLARPQLLYLRDLVLGWYAVAPF